MLGDVAANFRRALEHLAWAIVMRGRGGDRGFPLTKREAGDVYFPIYSDRDDFNGAIKRKLIGARRSDVSRVRRVQPYRLGKRGAAQHAFHILNSLCNADKHHAVQPVRIVPSEGRYQIREPRDCVPSTDLRLPRHRLIELEVGAELGCRPSQKTGPNPRAEIDAQLVVQLGVTNRSPLDEWLMKTSGLIRLLLLEFAEPPDQLAELGDPAWFFAPGDPRSAQKS